MLWGVVKGYVVGGETVDVVKPITLLCSIGYEEMTVSSCQEIIFFRVVNPPKSRKESAGVPSCPFVSVDVIWE